MRTFKITTALGEIYHICVPFEDAERTKQQFIQNYCKVEEVSNVCPF